MRKQIALGDPVAWFEKSVAEVSFLEPTGRQLMYGEPRTWITNADGAVYAVENPEVVGRYIDDLLRGADGEAIEGGAVAFFRLLKLRDALKVKDALFDFFTEARRS